MKPCVYILKCANGMYYTGSTHDLEKRLAEHQSGEGAIFTRKHLPVELVILKNMTVLMKHILEKNKYRDGVGRKKKF